MEPSSLFFFLSMYVCHVCARHVCACHVCAGAHRSWKGASDPVELKLQVVSSLT